MTKESITAQFQSIFGKNSDCAVRAPGRINLIGEHLDYNGGFVLPAAIDKAIWFAMGRRADGELHFHSADLHESFVGAVNSIQKSDKNWANYLLGVISEAQKDGLEIGGVNVVFGGDIPIGAGLSSSAALESGMMTGLNELFSLGLSKMDIVRLAQRGENNFVGMKCGIMDMFASVMGQEGHVVRLDCQNLEFQYIPFNADNLTLLLFDSGVKHALVDSEYNTRRKECETGLRFFREKYPSIQSFRDLHYTHVLAEEAHLPSAVFKRCKYVVEELVRVEETCKALNANDLQRFGLLMLDCHEGLHADYEVTCTETDFLVRQAMMHEGVLGARQMGGGFGGCTLNLVNEADTADFVGKMKLAYSGQFGIDLKCYPVKLEAGTTLSASLAIAG